MVCEVNNKEINSHCAELLVRPTYIIKNLTSLHDIISSVLLSFTIFHNLDKNWDMLEEFVRMPGSTFMVGEGLRIRDD